HVAADLYKLAGATGQFERILAAGAQGIGYTRARKRRYYDGAFQHAGSYRIATGTYPEIRASYAYRGYRCIQAKILFGRFCRFAGNGAGNAFEQIQFDHGFRGRFGVIVVAHYLQGAGRTHAYQCVVDKADMYMAVAV